MISIIVVLILAGVLLWAVTQLPLDPAIVQLIRVLVVVVCVFWVVEILFGGGGFGLRAPPLR